MHPAAIHPIARRLRLWLVLAAIAVLALFHPEAALCLATIAAASACCGSGASCGPCSTMPTSLSVTLAGLTSDYCDDCESGNVTVVCTQISFGCALFGQTTIGGLCNGSAPPDLHVIAGYADSGGFVQINVTGDVSSFAWNPLNGSQGTGATTTAVSQPTDCRGISPVAVTISDTSPGPPNHHFCDWSAVTATVVP